MSKKYINNDYTLQIYASNIKDETSTKIIPGTGRQEDGRSFESSVNTSDNKSHILFATASLHDAFGEYGGGYRLHGGASRNQYLFGNSAQVSGSTIAITINGGHTVARDNNYAGVMILDSGSSGWQGSHHLRVSSDLFVTASGGANTNSDFGAAWSYDRKYGRTVAIAQRSQHTGGNTSPGNGCVHIFTSSSSGFSHAQIITTASLPSSIMNHWGQHNKDGDNIYWARGYQGWCSTVRVDGKWMTIGSLFRIGAPSSEWDEPSRMTSTHSYSPGVVLFKSSSSGWVYNRFLDGYDLWYTNASHSDYSIDTQVSHDLRDGTCVFAGRGGWGGSLSGTDFRSQAGNGRIRVWRLNDDDETWRNDGYYDLHKLGLLDDMHSTIQGSGAPYPTYPSLFPESGWTNGSTIPEFTLYKNFGRMGVAVSGNYIVASAESARIKSTWSGSPADAWEYVPNAIFILKSGSSEWYLDKKFTSPSPEQGGPANGTYYFDYFGYGGLAIDGDVIAVKASKYRYDQDGSNVTAGRVYTYRRSDATGWALDATIENPYKGQSNITAYLKGREEFAHGYVSLSGQYGESYSPGLGGGGEHLVIPFVSLSANDSDEEQFGAVYILSGSQNFREVPPSLQDISDNLAPFIKAVRFPANIRLQSGSSTPFSSEFGSSKNPG